MYRHTPDLNVFLVANAIANTPIFDPIGIQAWGGIPQNITNHHTSYVQNVLQPNSPGPFEHHPYIEHFSEDFDLNRNRLIIGTFPPNSYFHGLYPAGILAANPNILSPGGINYYYGNVGTFWRFMFAIAQPNLEQAKNILSKNDFSITDVFHYIQRSLMKSTDDAYLKNIIPNYRLNEIFKSESKITTIISTSGKLADLIGNGGDPNTMKGFKWILDNYLNHNNIIELSADNLIYFPYNNIGINNAINQQNINSTLTWWLKVNGKIFRIINLPSPSGRASTKIPRSIAFIKWFNNHIIQANANGVAIPLLNGGNIIQFYNLHFPLFNLYNPNLFTAPIGITNFYRKEIYQFVLNGFYNNLP